MLLEPLAQRHAPVLAVPVEDHRARQRLRIGLPREIVVGGVPDVHVLAVDPGKERELEVEEVAGA